MAAYRYVKPGLYRCHTGEVCNVAMVAFHLETDEAFVIYRGPDGLIIAHPYRLFVASIQDKDGVMIPKFQYIEE